MRILKHDYLIIAFVAPLLFMACADNDVYDPNKVRPVAPAENPLGEDFAAPDGFDWSMIATVQLNVEVKDEFNGQYNYLIELFTTDPLFDEVATPIATGYAKKGENYMTEISISKTVERLFIRQTTPNQYKEVYEYSVPENGGSLKCKLYYTEKTTRVNTRADNAPGTSGWDLIADPGYREEETSVPANAEAISGTMYNGNWLQRGIFVIKEGDTYKGSFSANNSSTLYVAGTWVPKDVNMQHVNIIVLKGGKIQSTGDFHVADYSSLTIQNGASAEYNTFSTATNIVVKNFGKFNAKSVNSFNTGTTLYNGENASFIAEKGIILKDTKVFNHGRIEITDENGILEPDQNSSSIANYAQAIIKVPTLQNFGCIVNSGTIETNICTNKSGGSLYNNCLLIARNSFQYTKIELDRGSIIGNRNETKNEWLPVNEFKIGQPTTITMKNGSIIKANAFWIDNSNNNITGIGDVDKSMIKVAELKVTNGGATNITGNLVLEGWSNVPNQIKIDENIPRTNYDDSKYTIENCGGVINEGNPGNPDPEDPPKTDTEDNTVYTYAFEDQWPAYGDFDMNDVVITIDKRSTTNSGKQVSIQGHVRAVGASRKTGIGIQFLNVSSSEVTLEGKVQSGTPVFERGQSNPVVILCTNAHKYCKPEIADDNFTFYCTDRSLGNEYNTGDGANFEIKMVFPTIEEAEKAFNIKNLDVFIITQDSHGSIGRTEVHMAGYAPTDLGAKELLGMGNDASEYNSMLNAPRRDYYISTKGLAWGICIPSTKAWEWPEERYLITTVYPDFEKWVLSGGQTDASNWISNHNNNVFVKP